MIYKTIQGNLGNIMFCIACAEQIKLDTSLEVKYINKTPFLQDYLDSDFFISKDQIATVTEDIKKLERIDEYQYNMYSLIPEKDNIVINGYRQSYKYFTRDLALELFKPEQYIINQIKEDYPNIHTLVSTHIRRTDYLSCPSLRVLDIEWYKRAIGLYPENQKFLIFSDDIQWCKDNFVGQNFIFSENHSPIYDLYAMSLCKDNIISNSTFSWWGAYLNTSPERKVYYSLPWDNVYRTNEIIPNNNNWINI